MLPYIINGKPFLIDRLQVDIPEIDIISWLKSQTLYPKVFWKERDSQLVRAAVGNLLTFSNIPHFSGDNPFDIRFYGGMRFANNTREDKTWDGFPSTSFWLPQIEITYDQKCTQAIIYSLNERASPFILQQHATSDNSPLCSNDLIQRKETPDLTHWKNNVDIILKSIQSGKIDKTVLARKSTLQFCHPLSAWSILSELNQKARHATVFAFQLSPHLCFLGATPEKLFQRENDQINTDAIAGTRPRGKTTEMDAHFENELLQNPKELREFKIVKDYLDSKLASLSLNRTWEHTDRVLKTSHVQHLHNRLNAQLKPTISDVNLIEALHPTPALGGIPRDRALDLLTQIEPFDRGWYGAPIGVISEQGACLYVAIRSALIRERTLDLFAGTGIVEGSLAEKEWEELEHKIRPFTELFH